MVKTFRTSRLMADVAILDDGLTHQQRESARIGCFMHLRDLTNSHPEFAPPRAVQFVRQCEAVARGAAARNARSARRNSARRRNSLLSLAEAKRPSWWRWLGLIG